MTPAAPTPRAVVAEHLGDDVEAAVLPADGAGPLLRQLVSEVPFGVGHVTGEGSTADGRAAGPIALDQGWLPSQTNQINLRGGLRTSDSPSPTWPTTVFVFRSALENSREKEKAMAVWSSSDRLQSRKG